MSVHDAGQLLFTYTEERITYRGVLLGYLRHDVHTGHWEFRGTTWNARGVMGFGSRESALEHVYWYASERDRIRGDTP